MVVKAWSSLKDILEEIRFAEGNGRKCGAQIGRFIEGAQIYNT